jgi:hypothetical protein
MQSLLRTTSFCSRRPAKNDCCGTSCTNVTFDPPQQYLQVLGDFEDGLEETALIAQEYTCTTWLSHVFCSQFDGTAAEAAKALNDGWCKTARHGMKADTDCQTLD